MGRKASLSPVRETRRVVQRGGPPNGHYGCFLLPMEDIEAGRAQDRACLLFAFGEASRVRLLYRGLVSLGKGWAAQLVTVPLTCDRTLPNLT